ncbi:MAG TPA: hypothetical protein VFF67_07440 [Thermoplasmata archaeon]|nr:hypothetical protein [Thermoplasmata archaeon]
MPFRTPSPAATRRELKRLPAARSAAELMRRASAPALSFPMTDLPIEQLIVELDVPLSEELRARSNALEGVGSLWVTDLLDPRTAYFRAMAPQPIPPDRREAIEVGRLRHDDFERATVEAEFREVRVFRDGIVGVIDVFEEMPTEVKTSESFPGPSELASQRPSYLEQVAMYCALADRPAGRLVLLGRDRSDGGPLVVYPLEVTRPEQVLGEMRRRRDVLRSAFAHRDPSGLPACRWYGQGCEYRGAEACPCTGSERALDPVILESVGSIAADAAETARLSARFAASPPSGQPRTAAARFSDLLFPRRAFFRAREPAGGGEPPPPPRPLDDDLYRHLVAVLDSGPAGESTREAPALPWVRERIGLFRGEPILLKVTRARSVTPAAELRTRQPHYLVDLALRCAAARRDGGWLVVGSERAVSRDERIRAIHLQVPVRASWEAVGAGRAAALGAAIRGEIDPSALPACPGWMFETCPYRDRCACGDPGPARAGAAIGR